MSETQENEYFIPKDVDSASDSGGEYDENEVNSREFDKGSEINNDLSNESDQEDREANIELEISIEIEENAQKIFDSLVSDYKDIGNRGEINDHDEIEYIKGHIECLVDNLMQIHTDVSYKITSPLMSLVDCRISAYRKLADALKRKISNHEDVRKKENDDILLSRVRNKIEEL